MKFKTILSLSLLFLFTSCSILNYGSNSNTESSTSGDYSVESSSSFTTSFTNDNSSSDTSSNNTLSSNASDSYASSSDTSNSYASSSNASDSYASSSDTLSSSTSNSEKNLKNLTILSINDLHGKIEQSNGLQGISNLHNEIQRIRDLTPDDDVVLIANGDMFQGQAISNLNHGLSVINAMNEMQFDMMGIGNHEFDWGIEEITRFFDGDIANGEANFPLVNSNVYKRSNDELLENTVYYHVINKSNLKIGFVSALGQNQYSSILKTKSEDYYFANMLSSLSDAAKVLREEEKCDIVIANIHDGGTTSYYTSNNMEIANFTGSKYIDVLINGHTHYGYAGLIERDGATPLPVVEAYSSGSSLGYINLEIEDKQVVNASASLIDMRYKEEYDQHIQDIVDNDYEILKSQIEEVYGIAGETVTQTEVLKNWSTSCMQKATDADIVFTNSGGLRKVNLIKGQNIMLKDIYEINPFDNEILLTTVSGSEINYFINRYGDYNYYTIKDGVTISNSSNSYYKVAVIDYLGFKNYFPLNENEYENTHLIFRDVMIKDIKKRTELGLTFNPSSDSSSYLSALI